MLKVSVGHTRRIGKGLFANTDLKKDESIFTAKGNIVRDSYGPDYWPGPNWLALGEQVWLDPFDDNPWRLINHSCNPNAGLRGKATVVAMKAIRKGEEVTLDYSVTEDDPHWKMRCKCGEKECRKVIRSIRFLPERLFRKYRKYIPAFLRKSYERTRPTPTSRRGS